MIHCIGNSHVWLFNGEPDSKFPTHDQSSPYFRVHWLGPTIAYNFFEHHLSKAIECLKDVPNTDKVMFILGEVDCRWHLPYQADKQKRSIEDVTVECVDRFFPCLLEIRKLGHEVIGWATHPTTTHGHMDPPGTDTIGPVFGDVQLRNAACVAWNTRLAELCKKENIPFLSIYHYLVDENNITKTEYLRDYCHLNNDKCLPFVLAEMDALGITY